MDRENDIKKYLQEELGYKENRIQTIQCIKNTPEWEAYNVLIGEGILLNADGFKDPSHMIVIRCQEDTTEEKILVPGCKHFWRRKGKYYLWGNEV